jgi:hypothetical protein
MTSDVQRHYAEAGVVLLPQHADLLAASAISPAVAHARGYRSIETKAELKRLGFGDAQRRAPALLLPVWGVHGDLVTYQIRPDAPRVDRDGKVIKYETRLGSRMALDVPASARAALGDPAQPLFITEGIRKADAGATATLGCVDLLGVWAWRGTNDEGGAVTLADWESIALKGRQLFIVFDSDVMLKPQVHAALARLRAVLARRGAEVALVYLPAGAGGMKVGLDDFLAAGHSVDDLLALSTTELRGGDPTEQAGASVYVERDTWLYWNRPTASGPVSTRLTNFLTRIVADVAEDDGVEIRRRYELVARIGAKRRQFSIPAAQFAGMSWPTEYLGAGAIVSPGMGLKDQARAAIQELSAADGELPERTVFTHTGWRTIGDLHVYLHAGGAIGPVGPVLGIDVALPDTLGRYCPPPRRREPSWPTPSGRRSPSCTSPPPASPSPSSRRSTARCSGARTSASTSPARPVPARASWPRSRCNTSVPS